MSGRWRLPDGTPVPPAVFIPAVEREGRLLALVERLVAESSDLLDEVAHTGLDGGGLVRIALNVSPLLADVSLADRLSQMVHDRSGDPRRFVCLLDDGALARAPARSLAVLTRLRVKGFGLSMSHCGVGPSWTNQLGRVPLTELKLARPLVSGAASESKRLQVLEDALVSARDTGLAVVADGCDSQADFDMLLALGCSEAQGPWVAGPMEARDVVAWARTGNLPDASAISG